MFLYTKWFPCSSWASNPPTVVFWNRAGGVRRFMSCSWEVNRGLWLFFHLFFCDLHRFHADKEELLHLTELPKLHYKQQGRPPATLQLMLHQSSLDGWAWLADSGSMAPACLTPQKRASQAPNHWNVTQRCKFWVRGGKGNYLYFVHFCFRVPYFFSVTFGNLF